MAQLQRMGRRSNAPLPEVLPDAFPFFNIGGPSPNHPNSCAELAVGGGAQGLLTRYVL